ncbi:MAG: helix-turn-helix domain-containing protein [Anaerolineaceae bacterium]|nr:helix-turn-helix domain-containing protein [Anaerolineaceae bacterium]
MTILTNDIYTITNLASLKAISDPLRMSIFQKIGAINQTGSLCTAKKLAKVLDLPQTKLYYHIKLLEQNNFIEVAETKVISGIIEKHYRVVSNKIAISADLLSGTDIGSESILSMAAGRFKNTLDDIQKSFQKPRDEETSQNVSLSRVMVRLSQDQAQEFLKNLLDLSEEFAMRGEDHTIEENTNTFGFTYAFYPIEEDNQVVHEGEYDD